jgi:hypothetical protein
MLIDKEDIAKLNLQYPLVKLLDEAVMQSKQVGDTTLHLGVLERGEDSGYWMKCESVCVNVGWRTEFSWLKEGDVVFLRRSAIRNAFGHDDDTTKYWQDEDHERYIVLDDTEYIVMVHRDGKIIAPPNKMVLSPVLPERLVSSIIQIPDSAQPLREENKFVVEAVGQSYDHKTHEYTGFDLTKVGDKISLFSKGGVPIQSKWSQTTDKDYFWCRHDELAYVWDAKNILR